jgi:hypothetical protein
MPKLLPLVPLLIFEVLTMTSMKMAVFWYVAPCSLVDIGGDGGSKVF